MGRKTSKTPSKILTFGCGQPADDYTAERIRDQGLLAHRYYNALIEVERNKRVVHRIERSRRYPELAVLEEREILLLAQKEKGEQVKDQLAELRKRMKVWKKKASDDGREERRAYRLVRTRLVPELQLLGELEEKKENLRAEIAATKKNDKDKKALLNARLKDLVNRAERESKHKGSILRKHSDQLDPLKPFSELVQERIGAAQRALRKSSGLYCGNYLLVEQAIKSALKSKLDPKFRPWVKAKTRIGVQLHREKIEDVLAGRSNFIQIEMSGVSSAHRKWIKRKSKHGGEYSSFVKVRGTKYPTATVRVRFDSDEKLKPIWGTFRVILDRPLRPGTTLTWAWIRVVTVADRKYYDLQLTAEHASYHLPWAGETWRSERPVGMNQTEALQRAVAQPTYVPAAQGRGSIGIDLGWRVLKGRGVRVAYMVDDRGSAFDLVIPQNVLDRIEQCWHLQSTRTKAFEAARDQLAVIDPAGLPEWFARVQKGDKKTRRGGPISKWKSERRLASLVKKLVDDMGERERLDTFWKQWHEERDFVGLDKWAEWETVAKWANKVGAPPLLLCAEWWSRQNTHLWRWIAGQRRHALAMRDDLYKTAASWIARGYGLIGMEDFDLRELAREDAKVYKEMPEEQATAFRRIRNFAAPGEFRLAVESACGKGRVIRVKMANSTREHVRCGHVSKWENQSPLILRCEGCGEEYDQDFNAAAVVLLRVGPEDNLLGEAAE